LISGHGPIHLKSFIQLPFTPPPPATISVLLALSSALCADVEDIIEIEYGLPESANLLWKPHEQIYGSSNHNRSSSTNVLENTSSYSTYIDQYQEGQSSDQKEKVKSTSLGKLNNLISQTGVFGLAEQKLSWLEKMIALHQVPTMMMMMTLTIKIMIKCSWKSFTNSLASI
jgi:hypothetical protein